MGILGEPTPEKGRLLIIRYSGEGPQAGDGHARKARQRKAARVAGAAPDGLLSSFLGGLGGLRPGDPEPTVRPRKPSYFEMTQANEPQPRIWGVRAPPLFLFGPPGGARALSCLDAFSKTWAAGANVTGVLGVSITHRRRPEYRHHTNRPDGPSSGEEGGRETIYHRIARLEITPSLGALFSAWSVWEILFGSLSVARVASQPAPGPDTHNWTPQRSRLLYISGVLSNPLTPSFAFPVSIHSHQLPCTGRHHVWQNFRPC